MTTGEYIALAAVGLSVIALFLSTRRNTKQDTTADTKAFTRLEVMMENVLDEIKNMGRNQDGITADQATCNTKIALLEQRVDTLEQHRRARPTKEGE
jgi:hypothetical protein